MKQKRKKNTNFSKCRQILLCKTLVWYNRCNMIPQFLAHNKKYALIVFVSPLKAKDHLILCSQVSHSTKGDFFSRTAPPPARRK